MVTDRAAAVLGLGDRYGVAPGRPAQLPAARRPPTGFDVVRRQVRPRTVVAQAAGSSPQGPATGEHPALARPRAGDRGLRPPRGPPSAGAGTLDRSPPENQHD